MKYYICFGFLALAAAHPRMKRGIIHDVQPQADDKLGYIGESSHQHHIQHDHAKSHQSIKFEHFHPVPVFVKKEHTHFLKHPVSQGKFEHNLKLIHPETEHKHGGGLVLENHKIEHGHEGQHGFDLGDLHQGFGEQDLHSFSEQGEDHAEGIAHLPDQPHQLEDLKGWSGSHEGAFGGEGQGGFGASHGLEEAGGHYQYEPVDLGQIGESEGHHEGGY